MRFIKKDPFSSNSGDFYSTSKKGLEWEEGAVDGQSQVEGFSESDRPVHAKASLRWLHIAFTLGCIVFAVQLFNLQVVQGEKYRELADGNRLRLQTILAPRGFITDRNGEALAKNTASFNLAVTPVDLPEENPEAIFKKVSELFAIPENDLVTAIDKSTGSIVEPIIVKRNITQQESILFEVNANSLPGFSLLNIPVRDYQSPEVFSHTLGYTGSISDVEYDRLRSEQYGLNDFIGKSGIELSYEKYLRGVNGNKQVEVDASGNPIKVLGTVEPDPGNIVQLSIDKGLQEKLYSEFARIGKNKGAAVAMNPKTGEILALVSVPGFNNNLFAPGIKTADYATLLEDKKLPLFNRAISGVYPPGSTIKMVTAGAALEEGVVTERTVIVDNGVLKIQNQFYPSVQYTYYGWKRDGLGPMTVTSAIAESSDIYFYTVAGGHPNSPINGLGAEKLAEYYKKFGMGKITGIDIQGEKPGVVSDPAWKANFHKNDPILSRWYLGNTYHISIGQGDMLTTPLQVAVWTAAIANNGTLNKPLILKQVLNQKGEVIFTPKPEPLITKSISDANMRIVQAGMRENVTGSKGSGRTLMTLPMTSAGKTGTSQFDGADLSRTHAWYTAYAPYENPEIVITVLAEAGGEGHEAATPIVREALRWWAENRMGK